MKKLLIISILLLTGCYRIDETHKAKQCITSEYSEYGHLLIEGKDSLYTLQFNLTDKSYINKNTLYGSPSIHIHNSTYDITIDCPELTIYERDHDMYEKMGILDKLK